MAARKTSKKRAAKRKTGSKKAPMKAAKTASKSKASPKRKKTVRRRKRGEILFALSLKATPTTVYQALLSPELYSEREHAHISHVEGGKIREFDGRVRGRNLELVPDKRIVQEWRREDWPPGVVSTATFTLKQTRMGTRLEFKQSGVPEYAEKSVKQDWKQRLIEPLKTMMESAFKDPGRSA